MTGSEETRADQRAGGRLQDSDNDTRLWDEARECEHETEGVNLPALWDVTNWGRLTAMANP